jgi:hypothetical protein
MFNRHVYFDRELHVKLDQKDAIAQNMKLPEGLQAVGVGLGTNGTPLVDIARELKNKILEPIMTEDSN